MHTDRTLSEIRSLGKKAGVSLNPSTPLAAVEEVLPIVDLVLIMSVNPGFGGQTLIPYTLDKTARLKSMLAERDLADVIIEIDGGITDETIARRRPGGSGRVRGGLRGLFKAGLRGGHKKIEKEY